MTQGKNGYVNVGDGKLYYEISGEGKTLVLVHAGFVDSRMWDDHWAEFARHYRVIRYDMRGFGRSDPATSPVSRRQELHDVFDALEIENAYLLGCSMGGGAVLDFALENPERVSALVLVSAAPGGFQMQGEPPPNLMEMIAAAQQGDLARTSELQIRIWVDGPFRQPDQVDPTVRQRASEMNRIAVAKRTWAIADSQPVDPLDPPAVQRLNEVQIPTLIIAGALDHPEVVRAADVMESQIKGARKVILQGGAHVPNMEQPAEFTHLVLDFLYTLQ